MKINNIKIIFFILLVVFLITICYNRNRRVEKFNTGMSVRNIILSAPTHTDFYNIKDYAYSDTWHFFDGNPYNKFDELISTDQENLFLKLIYFDLLRLINYHTTYDFGYTNINICPFSYAVDDYDPTNYMDTSKRGRLSPLRKIQKSNGVDYDPTGSQTTFQEDFQAESSGHKDNKKSAEKHLKAIAYNVIIAIFEEEVLAKNLINYILNGRSNLNNDQDFTASRNNFIKHFNFNIFGKVDFKNQVDKEYIYSTQIWDGREGSSLKVYKRNIFLINIYRDYKKGTKAAGAVPLLLFTMNDLKKLHRKSVLAYIYNDNRVETSKGEITNFVTKVDALINHLKEYGTNEFSDREKIYNKKDNGDPFKNYWNGIKEAFTDVQSLYKLKVAEAKTALEDAAILLINYLKFTTRDSDTYSVTGIPVLPAFATQEQVTAAEAAKAVADAAKAVADAAKEEEEGEEKWTKKKTAILKLVDTTLRGQAEIDYSPTVFKELKHIYDSVELEKMNEDLVMTKTEGEIIKITGKDDLYIPSLVQKIYDSTPSHKIADTYPEDTGSPTNKTELMNNIELYGFNNLLDDIKNKVNGITYIDITPELDWTLLYLTLSSIEYYIHAKNNEFTDHWNQGAELQMGNVLTTDYFEGKTMGDVINIDLSSYSNDHIKKYTKQGNQPRATSDQIINEVMRISRRSGLETLVTHLFKWNGKSGNENLRELKINSFMEQTAGFNKIKDIIDDIDIANLKTDILDEIGKSYYPSDLTPQIDLALFYLTVIYARYIIFKSSIITETDIMAVKYFLEVFDSKTIDSNATGTLNTLAGEHDITTIEETQGSPTIYLLSEELKKEVNRLAGTTVNYVTINSADPPLNTILLAEPVLITFNYEKVLEKVRTEINSLDPLKSNKTNVNALYIVIYVLHKYYENNMKDKVIFDKYAEQITPYIDIYIDNIFDEFFEDQELIGDNELRKLVKQYRVVKLIEKIEDVQNNYFTGVSGSSNLGGGHEITSVGDNTCELQGMLSLTESECKLYESKWQTFSDSTNTMGTTSDNTVPYGCAYDQISNPKIFNYNSNDLGKNYTPGNYKLICKNGDLMEKLTEFLGLPEGDTFDNIKNKIDSLFGGDPRIYSGNGFDVSTIKGKLEEVKTNIDSTGPKTPLGKQIKDFFKENGEDEPRLDLFVTQIETQLAQMIENKGNKVFSQSFGMMTF